MGASDEIVMQLHELRRKVDRLRKSLAHQWTTREHWTAAENKILRARYPHESSAKIAAELGRRLSQVYQHAAHFGLKKSRAYLDSPAACRLRRGDKVGASFRFPKGNRPWNAGLKGWKAPGSEKGWFKKGNKSHTWVPVGTERVSKDGYLERKISDRGGYNNDDWKPVAHLVWEKKRGPIPPGRALVFRDGNKRNFRLSNLKLLTRAQLMRRNTIHRYPTEVKQAIRLVGKLKRIIRKRREAA